MMIKKGQAAMEFLMTYGWAILVVLIAIGALMYFIKPTEMLPEKCTLPTGSGLFCDKWSATTGTLSLKIKNTLNDDVDILDTSEIKDDTNSCLAQAGAVSLDKTGGTNDVGTVVFDRDGSIGTCDDLADDDEKVQATISLKYTIDPGGKDFDKSTAGELIVKVP